MIQEDKYWRQRAKNHWCRDGDLNTKFFHASATSRKKVNRINFLENEVGIRVSDELGMRQVAKVYFETLFLDSNSTRGPVVDIIGKVVSNDDNVLLIAPFRLMSSRTLCFPCIQISVLARMVLIRVSFNIFGLFIILIFFRSVAPGSTIINFPQR